MSIASTGLGDEGRHGGAIKPLTVTVQTASVISGISPSKLWGLIKDGVLPVTRLGRRTLIHFSGLEALMLSSGTPPRQTPNRWATTEAPTPA
jgi:excisionase family DNA binding protein